MITIFTNAAKKKIEDFAKFCYDNDLKVTFDLDGTYDVHINKEAVLDELN